jgi:hypothetical protein
VSGAKCAASSLAAGRSPTPAGRSTAAEGRQQADPRHRSQRQRPQQHDFEACGVTEKLDARQEFVSVHAMDGKQCFVVIPFGRDIDDQRWFKGWYQAVIEPAISSCGFEPILAAAEDQPSAVNDAMRFDRIWFLTLWSS